MRPGAERQRANVEDRRPAVSGAAVPGAGETRLLVLVGAILFFNTMQLAVLSPLLPTLAEEHGLSVASSGLLVAAYPLGVLVASVPAALVGRRTGVRSMVVAGLVLISVGNVALAVGGSVRVLEIARLIQGAGTGASWAAALAWLMAATAAHRHDALIGRTAAATMLGALAGPAVGGFAAVIGAAPVFAVVALLGAGLVASVSLVEPPGARVSRVRASPTARLGLVALAPGLALATLVALFSGAQAVLAPLALARSGWAPVGLTASYVVVSASSMLAAPMFGALLARHGRRRPLAVALLMASAGAAVFPWLDGRWLAAAVFVVLKLTTMLIWIAGVAAVADVASRRGIDHSLSFGLVNLVWAAGNMTGSVTSAAIAQSTGDAGPYGLVATWFGVVLLVVLASGRTDSAPTWRRRALPAGRTARS